MVICLSLHSELYVFLDTVRMLKELLTTCVDCGAR
jgi:hypothetical protein